MKVLVTGASGQLGHDVVNELAARGHLCVESGTAPRHTGIEDGTGEISSCYEQMDITNEEAVVRVLERVRPDAVIHCAAWTAVDLAEEVEKKAQVFAINAEGTRRIAQECGRLGCKLMYISTDYVFDGQGETPWQPDCVNYAPLNVYGRTKLEGEKAVQKWVERYFIVRTAWVFGINGGNFVKTMLRLGQTHETVRVVCDQVGTPTYTLDLARLLVDMIETERYGCYHATNEGGYISWADFAREIFKQAGMKTRVLPVTTEKYGLLRAARPHNSRLDKRKLAENGFKPLPHWQDALVRFLETLRDAQFS